MKTASWNTVNVRARLAALVLVAGSAATVSLMSGCGQRSLQAVRDSGDRHYDRGRFVEAEADYAEFVERYPGDPWGHYNLGRAQIKTDKPAQARENLFIAYSQRPGDDAVFAALCEALLANKEYAELSNVLRLRALDKQRVSDYLTWGDFAGRMGDADQAEQALLTAARLDKGTSVKPQLALHDLYNSVGDRPKALERLRMAFAISPTDRDVTQRVRESGEIVGPTFALTPAEAGGE